MSKTDDGGPAFCAWCPAAAVRKQGRLWLCATHYRFQQMRVQAKRHGLVVPSYEQLADLLSRAGTVCPGCSRQMNWLGVDGQATVLSLQHDRSGAIRFLCRSCNTRHAAMPGDSFYDLKPTEKWCQGCKIVQPLENFRGDNSGRWKSRQTYCRTCANKRLQEWIAKNREHVNAKQREGRRRRGEVAG